LEIDILSLMGMEADNDINEDEDEGEVVQDAKDLMMLERWRAHHELSVEDDGGGEENNGDDEDLGFDNIDSDDDSSECDDGGGGDDNGDSDDQDFGF
jgi:hypothetical protein